MCSYLSYYASHRSFFWTYCLLTDVYEMIFMIFLWIIKVNVCWVCDLVCIYPHRDKKNVYIYFHYVGSCVSNWFQASSKFHVYLTTIILDVWKAITRKNSCQHMLDNFMWFQIGMYHTIIRGILTRYVNKTP